MIQRIRLIKTDEQEVHNQEKHFSTVKDVLNEQMRLLTQQEQVSVNFANDFYRLVDGAGYDEIAAMISVTIAVWELIDIEGEVQDNASGNTEPIKRIER